MKKVFLKIISLSVAIAFVDQMAKFFIEKTFPEIISRNTGIAFGFDVGNIWAIIISNIVLMGIVVYAAKKELQIKNTITQIFLSMILGGGIGNLIDRIFRGYVVDYVSIWWYPSFNIADISISLGIAGIVIFFYKVKK